MEPSHHVHYLTIEKLYELLDDFTREADDRKIDPSKCFISFIGDEGLCISQKPETGSDLTGPLVGKIYLGSERFYPIR
jgi:hypothetical protein